MGHPVSRNLPRRPAGTLAPLGSHVAAIALPVSARGDFPRASRSFLLAALLLAASATATHAAGAPPFAELLQLSLADAPALLEQAANVRAADANARQARAWLNPSASATFENIGAPQNAGASQRQDTYSVTQPFEIGGKRAARIEAGERGLATAQARDRQARITFSAELALAYATAEAMQERRIFVGEELARANEDLRAVRALVQAGREAQLRVEQATASAAAARAAQHAATADAIEALERLSALVGARESYTGIDRPFLASAVAYRPLASQDPKEAPAVVTATAERDALAAQIRVEEKKSIPDIGLTAGTRTFGWTNGNALVVGVSMSIPLFDRNNAGIDAARHRASAADARLEAARLEAVAARRSALSRVAASELRLEAATQGESAAAEAYRLARIGYDAGRTSLLELLAIRRALTEARLLAIDARLARVRANAALSMADGRIAFGDLK